MILILVIVVKIIKAKIINIIVTIALNQFPTIPTLLKICFLLLGIIYLYTNLNLSISLLIINRYLSTVAVYH